MALYREQGFLPEGLLNYLALLGWAIAADRDVFTLEEMVRGVRDQRRQPQPGALRPQEGRGDQRLADATAAARRDHRAGACRSSRRPACSTRPTSPTGSCSTRRCRWSASGSTSSPRASMLDFLFVADADFTRTDELDDPGRDVVKASYDALSAIELWSTAAIDGALRAKLVDELGLKPRNAFGPVRIASRAARSARRCSSRSSCSVANDRSRACATRCPTDGCPQRPTTWGTTDSIASAGRASGDRSSGSRSWSSRCSSWHRSARCRRRVACWRPAQPSARGLDSVLDLDDVTPLGLAYVNLVLASAIPIAILAQPRAARPATGLADVGRRPHPLALLPRLPRALGGGTARDGGRDHVVPQGGGTEISTEPNAFTSHHPRLPARRPHPDAAAGGGGGVRVPRLPACRPSVGSSAAAASRCGSVVAALRPRARHRPGPADLRRPASPSGWWRACS